MRKILTLFVLILIVTSCKKDKYLTCSISELSDYEPTETTYLKNDDFYIDVNIIVNEPHELKPKPKEGFVYLDYYVDLNAKKLNNYENIEIIADINPLVKKLNYKWLYIDDYFIDSRRTNTTYTTCIGNYTATVGSKEYLDIRTIDYNDFEQLLRQNIVLIVKYNDDREIIRIPKDKINIKIYPLSE